MINVRSAFRNLMAVSALITCTLNAKTAAPDNPQSQKTRENLPDIATLVAFLNPSSVVLSVGNMNLTWKQLQRPVSMLLRPQGRNQTPASPEKARQQLRKMLQSCAQRGLLLQEAQNRKITVSKDDQLRYEAQLEQSLKGNRQKLTKEQFIASFAKRGQGSMLRMSYEDALKLMKLDELVFSDIKLDPAQIQAVKAYYKAINKALKQQNDEKKAGLLKLMADKKNHTQKGFENVVREYSEGVESKWGGELKYDFTRDELAAVCYLDKFDFKVGDVTPVCETNSAFRVVRVLREVPQKEGQPKLRVAQILVGKIPLNETSEDKLAAKLKTGLHRQKIAELVQALTRKYPVKTMFFPDGLWPKPAPKAKPAPQAPKADKSTQKSK